jgi:hypothetical protein
LPVKIISDQDPGPNIFGRIEVQDSSHLRDMAKSLAICHAKAQETLPGAVMKGWRYEEVPSGKIVSYNLYTFYDPPITAKGAPKADPRDPSNLNQAPHPIRASDNPPDDFGTTFIPGMRERRF